MSSTSHSAPEDGRTVDLLGVAYMGLRVPDPEAWATFGTEVVGLMPALHPPVRGEQGTVFLKADERQWRVALHRGDRPGMAYVGFDLRSEEAFGRAIAHLRAEGAEYRRGEAVECEQRGVRDLVVLCDPTGVGVELCWGPTIDGGFVSPAGVSRFVAGSLGFGHFVLLTPDLDASMDFYQRLLGMRLTDYTVVGPGMSVQFLRSGPRHHSVALTAVGPITGLHHIAFEVPDIDEVGWALERAVSAGCAITASLGRHKNDRMLSFYMRSPAGFEVEIGCGARLIDEGAWVVNHFTGGDEWGHHGLTGESLATSVASQ
jgi:2,3-dihydroxybiphenyl 1,2-dioxygenase